ncbi:hypothetical protein SELMODRAFT_425686 [Selaginella moellendorffii]|uniref:DUF4005 domain-containing protein n=1 Tax=Selaginella moellendorffii TaxID=88036 RepID=D8STY6_SELML|nr:protein IQ-DOMAIN 1 [Selaginella moellendorffii]EFJ12104.1 hypothetical protein SELMODRAFT_425686 [Selaginella moellendorffii]|eukprot:XP_002986774.1 protein IQ-DOMAIN 1 [Selaginella moellendorffii]
MGKSSRWFLSFIGVKSSKSSSSSSKEKISSFEERKSEESSKKKPRERRRWSFGRSSAKDSAVADAVRKSDDQRRHSHHHPLHDFDISDSLSFEKDQSKHAIAVAAASAAAAEAAVAAAQAAAAVVRLTSTGGSFRGCVSLEEWAAVIIQTGFRGYLARRALRALKAVVRLQALFRGHLVRKQAALTLHCMQALVKVQARARARRASDEGLPPQQQLRHRRQQHQQDVRPRKSVDGWDTSARNVDDLQCKFDQKQIGLLKRERALAYAYGHQSGANNLGCESETSPWEWSWLERWMAAHPWETQGGGPPAEESTRSAPDAAQQDRSSESSAKVVEIDSARFSKRRPRRKSGLSSESITFDTNTWSTSPPPNRPAEKQQLYAASFDRFSNDVQEKIYSAFVGDYDDEDSFLSTAKSSPAFSTTGSKTTKSNAFLSNRSEQHQADELYSYNYDGFPSYMASTKSTKAKSRSQSAPKQRPSSSSERQQHHSRKRNSLSGLDMRPGNGNFGGSSRHHQQRQQQISPARRNSNSNRGAFTGPLSLDRSWMSLRDAGGDFRRPFRP